MTINTIEHETLEQLMQHDDFIHRHIGPSDSEIEEMLSTVGAASLEDLIKTTVPASIELGQPLNLPKHQASASMVIQKDKFQCMSESP